MGINWEAFWDKQATQADRAAQVGRVNRGNSAATDLNLQLAEYLAEQLDLKPDDQLLDVCCGNGDITALLASKVAFCLGVDLSTALLQQARQAHPQLNFIRVNALQLSGIGRTFSKINLYFSFQYFENYETGLRVLSEMNALLQPGGRIFIGDTPDARRKQQYYQGAVKKLRYYWQRFRGTENMGKFWHPAEFERMAEWLGLEVKIMTQPPHLPYSWYRFDACFYKPIHPEYTNELG